MKNLFYSILIAVNTIVLFSCSGEKKGEETNETSNPPTDTLFYKTVQFSSQHGPCSQPENLCCTFDIEYVLFEGTDSISRNNLNDLTNRFFSSMMNGDSLMTLKEASEQTGKLFLETLSDEFAMGWFFEGSSRVFFRNESLISLSMSMYAFEGGAHPNSFVEMFTYDLDSEKKLALKDVFTDAKALTSVAEEQFRVDHEIKKGDSFEEAGFDFLEDGFYASENFMFEKDTLVLFYNTYEIAAYVMGPTEVRIPLSKIRNLIHPEILAKLEKHV